MTRDCRTMSASVYCIHWWMQNCAFPSQPGFAISWPRTVSHSRLLMLQFFALWRLVGRYRIALGGTAAITGLPTCMRYRLHIAVVVIYPGRYLEIGKVFRCRI